MQQTCKNNANNLDKQTNRIPTITLDIFIRITPQQQ